MKPERTRFAPSPTGSLHVGGVRTALYCLLTARITRGAFLLRIEDTDRVRSTEEAARGIVRDLEWVGLSWDEGPFYQSQRLALYQEHARRLVASGHAYEAYESPEELDRERKLAKARKENFRYRRRPYGEADLARFREQGRRPVIRLVAPVAAITVEDGILGPVTVEAGAIDDFVLIKADGFPTYHFAVVVDDHEMGITLVLRGQEHLMNTHKHVLIYAAFGWTPPAHAHLPLIFNAAGSKMSKRDKAKVAREALKKAPETAIPGVAPRDLADFLARKSDSVAVANAVANALGIALPMIEVQDYRVAGYLPEGLSNYLGLLGWSPGDDRELLTPADLLASFSLERVIKTPARFDVDKLGWINGEYLKSLPDAVLLRRLAQWLDVVDSPIALLPEDRRRALLAMYRPRVRTFVELERLAGFLFRAPAAWDGRQVDKHLAKDGGWDRLGAVRTALTTVDPWDPATLQATIEGLVAASGLGMGKFAQPVRIAVTGDGVSPEIVETLAFLGRDETLQRVDRFLATRDAR